MSNPGKSIQEECQLTEYVIHQLGSRLSGRAYAECERNYPHDVYFIGNLRSDDVRPDQQTTAAHLPELMTKLSPVAFGSEFRLKSDADGTVHVRLQWSCYYQIFPSYDQQLEHSRALTGTSPRKAAQPSARGPAKLALETEDDEDEPSNDDDRENSQKEYSEIQTPTQDVGKNDVLMLRFRKISCCAEGDVLLTRSPQGDWVCENEGLENSIKVEVERALTVVQSDPDRIRAALDAYAQIRVPDAAMKSAAAYDIFKRALPVLVTPSWKWEIRSSVRVEGDDIGVPVFSIMFINQTSRQFNGAGKDNPCIESFLFDTRAHFNFQKCGVTPFSIDLAPKGFRYDPTMWARPFNCSVMALSSPNEFQTNHVPTLLQSRLATRDIPTALFADLASNPNQTLEGVLRAMEAYRSTWTAQKEVYEAASADWKRLHASEFDADYRTYETEIERFRRGCDLIRSNDDVALAFRLTNETFELSGRHVGKIGWRLFQLVFLVSQIPGIASLATSDPEDAAELKRVDIVYFPTGGGKTEAYLSVLAFHVFFDRLRMKSAGVTAWTRFPLRLLTLQQTQRVADIICVADLVRRGHSDKRLSGKSVAGFGVGYFVGKTSTPNELVVENYKYASSEDKATWAAASDDTQRQNWRRLIHCPSCWTVNVRVEFDAEHARLLHKCMEPACAFKDGHIPIYVVDNEIYRYLPSVLVGTIDKLASLGNQRKMALIFGAVDGICPKHGYYKGKCCQKDCNNKLLGKTIPSGLSGPTLFVQDELHLLKEGLGTFDGHYETFVRELQNQLKPNSPLKIIASSATIENFKRQIEHLYGSDPELARMFPGPGPRLGESFYARTLDHPQRCFVGLVPHNKTIFNAMLELLEHYHRIIQELIKLPAGANNPFDGSTAPGTDAWFALLDGYVTSLTYFLSSRELNSVHTDLDGHVSPILEAEGFSPLRVMELTGSTSTDEVASTLEYLDRSKPKSESATSVLATNMVSHGVDVNRLNTMFFYGMPRQNAEYIQASSRVGRSHLGMVFVCHHPARERDRSHYDVFAKFHEYLGQLVEPVAINRWATFSVNRTLPGLFMAIMLQLIANRADPKKINQYYLTDHVRKQISAGAIRPNDFVPILERAYRVEMANDRARQHFQAEIRVRVQQFLDSIVQSDKNFVSDTLIPRPMTSLRDVDEPIPIALDRAGTQWASQTGRQGARP